jgi:hypothetical protein
MPHASLPTLLRAALVALALATPARAEWSVGSFDNGQWFESWVSIPVGTGAVALQCGGLSPKGLPPPASDEPMLTDPYTLGLRVSNELTGRPEPLSGGQLPGAMMVAGATGYLLNDFGWDIVNSGALRQPVAFADPLIAALLSETRIELHLPGVAPISLGNAGLRDSLLQALAYCDARWAALGEAVPAAAIPVVNAARTAAVASSAPPAPSAAAATAGPTEMLRAQVAVRVVKVCEAEGDLGPDALLSGDIDGDGLADLVLNWAEVTCRGAIARPLCGAAFCSADLFLTTRPDAPLSDLIAVGVSLEPGTEGRMDLVTGLTAASCENATRPASCEQVWRWTGTGLALLPPGAK